MKVIAIIEDPDELGRILRHLVKFGWSPPGSAFFAANGSKALLVWFTATWASGQGVGLMKP